ncbi:MORN repeat variant [compost metagenome]
MKARILCLLLLLIASYHYGQSADSVIVFDLKKYHASLFNSKKADSTFCHFYISEMADTVYFSSLDGVVVCLETTPTTFKYFLQNGLANGAFKIFFDFRTYSSLLDGKFVKGSLAEGTVKEHYKSGRLKLTGQLLEGQRFGIWTWYYENGQMQRLVTYDMGEPVDEQEFRIKEPHANDKLGDTLLFSYHSGYDCSKTIDSKSMRGGCESWEKITYVKRKQAYKMRSFDIRSSFREWNGSFGPNRIADSMERPVVFRNRKLPAKKMENFLREICSVYSDTVFRYRMEDVPEKFLKKNDWTEENRDSAEVDSLIRESFNSVAVSSVVSKLSISFRLGGKQYELYKDPNNPYWRLYLSEDETGERIQFIYFAFDAFLSGEFPKNFSGRRTLN